LIFGEKLESNHFDFNAIYLQQNDTNFLSLFDGKITKIALKFVIYMREEKNCVYVVAVSV